MIMSLYLEKKVKRNKMENSRRQNRTRYKLKKVTNRKRLTVFKSNNHIYVQIINDEVGKTLASVSSMEKLSKTWSAALELFLGLPMPILILE